MEEEWDAGAFRDKAPLGHMREVSVKVIPGGWLRETADAKHDEVKYNPQTQAKIYAVDWLERHENLLPEAGRGDASMWPKPVIDTMLT